MRLPRGSSAGQSLEFKLANRFYSSDELPPPSGWLQGLQQRWQELSSVTAGFALPECADVNEMAATELREFAEKVETVFHQAVQTAEAGAASDNTDLKPGYLGMVMDSQKMILRRQGISASVEFTSTPVLWRILDVLVRNRGGLTNYSDIIGAWTESEPPALGRIRNLMSDLRKKLRSLHVEIQTNRGVGWQLRNLANDDA